MFLTKSFFITFIFLILSDALIARPLTLKIESEVASSRDGNYEIQGSQSYFLFEPRFKISKSINVSIGEQYNFRKSGGTLTGAKKANRDHLDNIFAKFAYTYTKFNKNHISDLRFQARIYSDQDDFFKQRYGANGNYQLRAYFGRPIYGRLYISKYTSYIRYKNYLNNQFVNKYTRDFELRVRLSPTYRVVDGFDLGLTLSYNHIFKVQKGSDEETVDLDLTSRYQFGKYAALFRVSVPYMNNLKGKQEELTVNEHVGENHGYALTLTANL